MNPASRSLLLLCLGVLLSRLALTGLGVLVRDGKILAEPPRSFAAQPVSSHQWLNTWIAWDAGWYARIAQEWYAAPPTTQIQHQAYAFSPLYPALIRPFVMVVGHPYVIGWLFSNLFLFGWMIVLYQYVRSKAPAAQARETIIWLLLFPAAFVFSGMMTESLFVLLSVITLFAADRRQWWLAGVFGALLTLTRPIGVFIFIPLFVMWLGQQPRRLTTLIPLVMIPITFGLWLWTQRLRTDDAFAFLHAQADWRRHVGNPLVQLWTALTAHNSYDRTLGWFIVAVLVILVLLWKNMTWVERTYVWTFTLIPLAAGWYSFPRYTLALWPVAITLTRLHWHPVAKYGTMVALAVVQIYLFLHWPTNSSLVI